MRVTGFRTLVFALSFLAIGLVSTAARSAVITFGPGPIGTPVTATAEGIFTYDTFSGGLFRDTQGNGDGFDMEGCSACGFGGGVLSLVRNDVAGGLFTFGGSDISYQFNLAGYAITFEGFLGGVSQGIDTFLTAAGSVYTTHLSSNLSGVPIDELRVTLGAGGLFATTIDNLIVNAARVPEPGTLALLGLGLAGLAAMRRRRS